MSFLSFFSKEKEEVALLIDIGNGTMTSALVLFSKREVPRFLYAISSQFSVTDFPDAKHLSQSLNTLLEVQMAQITKEGFQHKYWQGKSKNIAGGMVAFSSPWFILKTKHLSLSNETPFIITSRFLKNIIEREGDAFRKELFEDKEHSFEVIEKSIVHTKINGYTLENSLGKKTKNFEAFLCLSIVDAEVLSKIYQTVLRNVHVPKENLLVHTFPLVSFSVVRDIAPVNSDFILLDITADVTDLTLVSDNVIMQTVSMPSGKNFILRQISKVFGVSNEIGQSMLDMYNLEKLDAASHEKMQEVLINVEKEWSIYLENALLELSSDMNLPVKIYLTADNDVAKLYTNFLKLSKTDVTSNFRKNASVIHVSQELLSQLYKNDSLSPVDEFIVILAIFYKKILETR